MEHRRYRTVPAAAGGTAASDMSDVADDVVLRRVTCKMMQDILKWDDVRSAWFLSATGEAGDENALPVTAVWLQGYVSVRQRPDVAEGVCEVCVDDHSAVVTMEGGESALRHAGQYCAMVAELVAAPPHGRRADAWHSALVSRIHAVDAAGGAASGAWADELRHYATHALRMPSP